MFDKSWSDRGILQRFRVVSMECQCFQCDWLGCLFLLMWVQMLVSKHYTVIRLRGLQLPPGGEKHLLNSDLRILSLHSGELKYLKILVIIISNLLAYKNIDNHDLRQAKPEQSPNILHSSNVPDSSLYLSYGSLTQTRTTIPTCYSDQHC